MRRKMLLLLQEIFKKLEKKLVFGEMKNLRNLCRKPLKI